MLARQPIAHLRSAASVVQCSPHQPQWTPEAKKSNFDMAEYDDEFIDRLMEMGNEGFMAYLHSLPEVERKMLEEAISREISRRAVGERKDELRGGLIN